MAEGDEVEVFDGQGLCGRATVVDSTNSEAYLDIQSILVVPKPDHELFLATATPKGDRADWLVEKATEIGVSGVIWLQTERSVVVPKVGTKKFERFGRIIESAARQSGRFHSLSLEGPESIEAICARKFDARWVATPHSEGAVRPVPNLYGRAVVVIGPEGGLTCHELEQLKKSGYNDLCLSPHVLRTETAAVAAAAVLIARP